MHRVNKAHFGALLIPMIQEKIPGDLDLLISQKMGKDSWNIDDYLANLHEEVEARESCKNERKIDTKNEANVSLPAEFTVQMLINTALQRIQNGMIPRSETPKKTNQNQRKRPCTFCQGEHYSDKCSVVVDHKKRLELVKTNNLCQICLQTGHKFAECPQI